MRNMLIGLAGSLALLAACTTMEDEGAAPAAMADMTPEARSAYVAMAGASDLYEIQSGQLAQQRSQRAEVRQFGQMLVDHHRNTTDQVMAAARASGLNPPPPTLMPLQRDMLAELQQASGSRFDELFVRQQVQAHEMALNLHRNYASNGDTPALRAVASAAVPIVTAHLEQARRLD